MKMKQTVIIILWSILILSCDKTKTFELDRSIVSIIENNISCVKLLSEGFGINEVTSKKVGFFETLLDKIIDENKGVKYHRLVILKIYEEGEVMNTSRITFGVLENGEGFLNEYSSHKVESKKIMSMDLDLLYRKIGEPQNKIVSGRTRVLIIDIKNNDNFECKLYDNLSAENINKIKNLTIFDGNGGNGTD